jgi:uncharacterized Fe-S cluster-containing radical SAM superfamily protein
MINPEEVALKLRNRVKKEDRYLIAKISGSEQAPGETKILEDYFRFKDYLDREENQDWFSASLSKVWDAKLWKGLRKNFRGLPLESIKKLEFENPCYSAAFRLRGKFIGDPRDFAKVFTFQLNACNYDCNYCYVPLVLKTPNREWGKFFRAKEIVSAFLEIRKKYNLKMNVIRASGGEIFCIAPDLVYEIYSQIKDRNLDKEIYFWIDTNLSTTKIIKKFERELREMFKAKNVGIVGCFKGTCEEDFEILTGRNRKFYKNQFECTKFLLDLKADLYLYLSALAYGKDLKEIKEKLSYFIENLEKINENLPLRTELLVILDYPQALENRERCQKLGRPWPKTDQKDVFEIWYNLLKEKYGEKFWKFQCEIPL